ncbi:hypothetical protein [Deinococcus aerophilus]|uniref:Uncharacterized protein n=1 Tax=Deinococcus aerophilus TaxID=522488 RepID=A0ABQ2GHM8_9DEIO|nr:hypothetical protein [Deinococcus aerophilus]GGL95908.1 hypothetical protein GCM10010841_00370 [Deinococcus aerophilus]
MRRRWLIGMGVVWTLFTFGPLLGVLFALAVAGAAGCPVDEGGAYPCVVVGQDLGELLNVLFVLGWLGTVTLPLGAVAAGVAGVVWAAWGVYRWRVRSRP